MTGAQLLRRPFERWSPKTIIGMGVALLVVMVLFMPISMLLPVRGSTARLMEVVVNVLWWLSILLLVLGAWLSSSHRVRDQPVPVLRHHRGRQTVAALGALAMVVATMPTAFAAGLAVGPQWTERLVWLFLLALGVQGGLAIHLGRADAGSRDVPAWTMILALALGAAIGIAVLMLSRLGPGIAAILVPPLVAAPVVALVLGQLARMRPVGYGAAAALAALGGVMAFPLIWFSVAFFGGGI